MTAYAIAHLRTPQFNDDVMEYLERIQGTLDPFGGRFLVHGGDVEVKEGPWPGTIVVIQFPEIDDARAWYDSPAYQAILHLRTDHIEGEAILVSGVPVDYDPGAMAAAVKAQLAR
jgi:uncharacterized protein (DUF1330 family)